MPTDVEFANMEVFVEIMKPIIEITEALGAQKYITISMIRPLLHKLLNNILKNSDSDCTLTKMMKLILACDCILLIVYCHKLMVYNVQV